MPKLLIQSFDKPREANDKKIDTLHMRMNNIDQKQEVLKMAKFKLDMAHLLYDRELRHREVRRSELHTTTVEKYFPGKEALEDLVDHGTDTGRHTRHEYYVIKENGSVSYIACGLNRLTGCWEYAIAFQDLKKKGSSYEVGRTHTKFTRFIRATKEEQYKKLYIATLRLARGGKAMSCKAFMDYWPKIFRHFEDMEVEK